MGWFSRDKEEKKTFPWIDLTSLEQLDEVIELSNSQPVVLFKHSTRCSVSMMAKRNYEQNFNQGCDSYYLDLLKHRDVSNAIAEKLHITHQSPQAILLKNGQVEYHDSHSGINHRMIEKLIK